MEEAMESIDESWNGQPWFPGCYTGDNTLHDFVVGAVAAIWREV